MAGGIKSLRLVLAALFCLVTGAAQASEYDQVFDQLLFNPTNPALNIRYAELSEQRGDLRKALGAYERLIAMDPHNKELRREYYRIRNRLLPNVTAITADIGIDYATNPEQLPGFFQRDSDFTFDGGVQLFDERTLHDHRWRTVGFARGQVQAQISELNDAQGSIWTGPVFWIDPKTRLHVAPGTGGAFLDDRWLWYDALVRTTLERVVGGATQTISALVDYRETNDSFNGSSGWLIEVEGNFSAHDNLIGGDALYLLPRFRYSEPTGSGPGRVFNRPLFLGDFYEYGSRAAYFFPVLNNNAILGGGFGAYYRDYNQNVAFESKKREDWYLEPTAHVILPSFIGPKTDLRGDYRYEYNDSNDPSEEFENHVVGARAVRRF